MLIKYHQVPTSTIRVNYLVQILPNLLGNVSDILNTVTELNMTHYYSASN